MRRFMAAVSNETGAAGEPGGAGGASKEATFDYVRAR